MTLYEINQAILDCVDAETGEVLDVESLDRLQMDKAEKIGNIAAYIKNVDAEAKALKEEENNLSNRRKACENKAKRLREYLQDALQGQKYKDSRVSIYYGKSPKAVRFKGNDEQAFIAWAKDAAPEYLTYPEPVVNKGKLKEDIEAGLEFSLATLEQNQYIVVK